MSDSGQRADGTGSPAGHEGPRVRDEAPGRERRLMLANEFAAVAVEVNTNANGPRLRIVNLGNGRSTFLDPLEVASLTWLTHEDLGPFLDPSRTGWRSDSDRPSEEGDAQ
jgi:hypothetical protein